MTEAKELFLETEHVAAGAKFAPFAGWKMPLQYTGVIPEHLAVRQQCGLFDVSHMGELTVKGTGAEDFLQKLTCNDLSKIAIGRAQYSAFLNETGGVIDDIIIYKLAEQDYFICVNASNRVEDFAWLQSHTEEFDVQIADVSENYCLLAVQGPKALDLVGELALIPDRRFSFVRQGECLIARTGYTGEDGVEIFVPNDGAKELFSNLMTTGQRYGLTLCGLGARDSLRLEAAYPLHGHELSPTERADESGLSWVIKSSKGEFIGRDALLASAAKNELVGLKILDPGIVRQSAMISHDAATIGSVTSGTKTPSLEYPVAMARIAKNAPELVEVDVRGRKLRAQRVATPFYRAAI